MCIEIRLILIVTKITEHQLFFHMMSINNIIKIAKIRCVHAIQK